MLINNIHITRDIPNLSNLGLRASINLNNGDDEVLKKADKGTAMVILDKDDYITNAHIQILTMNIIGHWMAQCT